jgi:hypothetical protein
MACKCDVGLGNTGTPNCQPIATVARKLIMVPLYKDDGTKNFIEIGVDTLDQAYLDGKINNADASQRWFPLPQMENITQERAESIFETAPSGVTAKIREGAKSFSGEVWKQSPTFLGKLKEAACLKFGVYVVDNDENIIGYEPDADGKVYPIAVDNNSFDPRLVDATDALVQKILVAFNFADSMRDEFLVMLTEDDYTFDAINSKGLLDVTSANSAITTTTFTVTLSTAYGSVASPVKVKGLVLGDFTLAELSPTPGAIVITSVTESADGVYDFVIPAAKSADVLELTPSKNGFDFTAVVANTITIP